MAESFLERWTKVIKATPSHSEPDILDASRRIREAVEIIEHKMEAMPNEPTKRLARLQLAWHHLLDAHVLLLKGDLAPADLVWGSEAAKKLLNPEH